MKIDILTIFPEMFASPFNQSIIKRAQDRGLVSINCINIRAFAGDKHQQVDDYPYGGGAGMVMKPNVIGKALDNIRSAESFLVYLTPQGKPLVQDVAEFIARKPHLILLCGHYEGVDERVIKEFDMEISIGDYVLTGGEIPAMVLVDAVARLVPGVLGDENSSVHESFSGLLLEHPHYTRPREYMGQSIPEVLVSGHHENIRLWRKKQSLLRTLLKRPDLLLNRIYSQEEKKLLQEILFGRDDT